MTYDLLIYIIKNIFFKILYNICNLKNLKHFN